METVVWHGTLKMDEDKGTGTIVVIVADIGVVSQ